MSFTAFAGQTCLASGDLLEVARAVAGAQQGQALVFDDATGEQVDLDLPRGPEAAVAEYAARTGEAAPAPKAGPGRPKLGVVAREVTLLPRHWDWLAAQPGGASATLRRLVEEARRAGADADRARTAQQALHRAMTVLAGDLPGFEEAARALYARDDTRFDALVAAWPRDVRAYLARMAATDRVTRPRE